MKQTGSRDLFVVSLVVLNLALQSLWTIPVESIKDELNYDPEYNSNGILTELDVSRLVPAPAIKKWSYDDHQDDENYLVIPGRPTQRRSDIDDDDEDEKDEQKSGSSAHGSYSESPAYGESAKAAQDGDDIENFFDTHLGPQDAAEVSERDEAPEQTTNSRTRLVDPDDQYDTAASSPLSEIFQSLLKVHRRPIVIKTTEKAPVTSPVSASSTRPVTSGTMVQPSSSGSSATSLGGLPFVPGSPFLDQSHQFSGQSSNSYASSSSSNHDDSGNSVREVYIARRPSLFAPFTAKVIEQQANPEPIQHHFQPNQWRGIPTNDNRATDQEDRQHVSASFNSFSTGNQYPLSTASGASNDEPQTVSYGLSFGSGSRSGLGSSLFPSLFGGSSSGSSSSSYSSSSNEPLPQVNYNSGYNSMANSIRQPVSAPVTYQNNYRQPYYQSTTLDQKYNSYQQPLTDGQYYPLESAAELAKQQYSNNNYGRNNRGLAQAADESLDAKNWIIRQHLLEKVDQQLKNNTYYRQSLAQASQQFPVAETIRFKQPTNRVPQRVIDTDVTMFNSMHSVTDPYSTFTSATSLISEPQPENSLRKGVNIDPSGGAGIGVSSTRIQAIHKSTPMSKCAEAESRTAQINSSPSQPNSFVSNQPKQELLRNKPPIVAATSKPLVRVRREDADDRENDDVDDDGVWVDDEEDDDNKQTASDVNETSQDPQDDNQDNQQEQTDSRRYVNPPGYIGHNHGYEIAL